ncbi:MAG: hypothetical protein NTX76_05235 [Alphaproteobacteria bacterium]|nr:hypothetical protein [Alphaproteobacteria bacterium]
MNSLKLISLALAVPFVVGSAFSANLQEPGSPRLERHDSFADLAAVPDAQRRVFEAKYEDLQNEMRVVLQKAQELSEAAKMFPEGSRQQRSFDGIHRKLQDAGMILYQARVYGGQNYSGIGLAYDDPRTQRVVEHDTNSSKPYSQRPDASGTNLPGLESLSVVADETRLNAGNGLNQLYPEYHAPKK